MYAKFFSSFVIQFHVNQPHGFPRCHSFRLGADTWILGFVSADGVRRAVAVRPVLTRVEAGAHRPAGRGTARAPTAPGLRAQKRVRVRIHRSI